MAMTEPTICPECAQGKHGNCTETMLVEQEGEDVWVPCTCTHGLPVTPYAGTGGWSGSETSRERAEREARDGTLTERQLRVLRHVAEAGVRGTTYPEVDKALGIGHSQSSSALSNLHQAGRISRIKERRLRCEVYVMPEHVGERDLSPFRPNRVPLTSSPDAAAAVESAFETAVSWYLHGDPDDDSLTEIRNNLLEALDRITRRKT